jgi:NDP-sugar pyrophosphorylase family protein
VPPACSSTRRNPPAASPEPDLRHIDYGLSILTAAALARYPAGARFDLSRVFDDLLADGQLAGFEVADRFFEIGSPEGLRDTEALLTQPRPAR